MTTKPLIAALSALMLVACGSDDDSSSNNTPNSQPEQPTTQNISLKFSASVGAEAVACGTSTTLVGNGNGGNGTAPDIKDFRLYVSDVQVATATGEFVAVTLAESDWQQERVALLDFEDGTSSCSAGTSETRLVVEGTAPTADYSRVRFTIGVPEALNHLNQETASAPLNIGGLHWNWAGGYKHARIDVAGWNIHLATTGCTLDDNNENLDCSNARPNRPTYTLDNVDLEDSTINFDYAELVSGADISTDQGGKPGCMSAAADPECATLFTNLGLNVTTGQCLDGADGCDVQSWVTVK